jgi:hypothetical protein
VRAQRGEREMLGIMNTVFGAEKRAKLCNDR